MDLVPRRAQNPSRARQYCSAPTIAHLYISKKYHSKHQFFFFNVSKSSHVLEDTLGAKQNTAVGQMLVETLDFRSLLGGVFCGSWALPSRSTVLHKRPIGAYITHSSGLKVG